MRAFEIVDGNKLATARPCGVLFYEPQSKTFTIAINPEAGLDDVPEFFVPFIEHDQREIPKEWAFVWVQKRIPPSSKKSSVGILSPLGLEEDDALALLLADEGRCDQDSFVVREIRYLDKAPRYKYFAIDLEPLNAIELKESFGRQIKEIRIARDMTQADLGYRSGIPRSMISALEHGLANPTLETLAAIARGLQCDVSVLLSDRRL